KFCQNMLPKCGRAAADIHGDIQDSPSHNGNQLGLGPRRQLEMQSTQRPRQFGVSLVVLDEAARDAIVVQPLLMKDFAGPTAVISMPLGNDDARQIDQSCRAVTHAAISMLWRCWGVRSGSTGAAQALMSTHKSYIPPRKG